jgi:hypothetical protein
VESAGSVLEISMGCSAQAFNILLPPPVKLLFSHLKKTYQVRAVWTKHMGKKKLNKGLHIDPY